MKKRAAKNDVSKTRNVRSKSGEEVAFPAAPVRLGLPPRSLKYMRAFTAAWPGAAIVQELAAQIPWMQCLYLSAMDDLLRHPDDQPSIDLILCRSKNKLVAEYALRGFSNPMGVAEWETQIMKKLPKELESSLPSIAEIEAELAQGEVR